MPDSPVKLPDPVFANPIEADLDLILEKAGLELESLKGKSLFISGGTGFFGSWLIECLLWANARLSLDLSMTVLSRNPAQFRARMSHLVFEPVIEFQQGDIQNFAFPEKHVDLVIHMAATSATATFNNDDALAKFDMIVNGTRRILDFSCNKNVQRFLMISSGPVYGRQPEGLEGFSENHLGAPDTLEVTAALGHAKRTAEFLCSAYSDKYGMDVVIARCFSFVGPYLQLDIHYAIGNFIRDALRHETIKVKGNGQPQRSYLYSADLIIWLITILVKGKSGQAYNVGSEVNISIAELASLVASKAVPPVSVEIEDRQTSSQHNNKYIPSTKKAREQLGLVQYTDLDSAIEKTLGFYRGQRSVYGI